MVLDACIVKGSTQGHGLLHYPQKCKMSFLHLSNTVAFRLPCTCKHAWLREIAARHIVSTSMLSVSRSIMCVERSAPRRAASPPVLVAPHGLLLARFHVTIPPDGLQLYIRRYHYDTLT